MPTTTFFNLPEDKKIRIFDAAVQEFASHNFKDASINQIVKQAQIPRGSFYQYFADKEDLYLYVLQKITDEKMEVYSRFALPEEGDFFVATLAALPAIFRWVKEKPLYNQIGMRMVQGTPNWNGHPLEKMDQSARFLYNLLEQDQENGKIKKDIDLDIVANIFYTVSIRMLEDYFTGDGSEEHFTEKLTSFFHILKFGISS